MCSVGVSEATRTAIVCDCAVGDDGALLVVHNVDRGSHDTFAQCFILPKVPWA